MLFSHSAVCPTPSRMLLLFKTTPANKGLSWCQFIFLKTAKQWFVFTGVLLQVEQLHAAIWLYPRSPQEDWEILWENYCGGMYRGEFIILNLVLWAKSIVVLWYLVLVESGLGGRQWHNPQQLLTGNYQDPTWIFWYAPVWWTDTHPIIQAETY